MSQTTATVSFRLPKSYLARLDAAAKQAGSTRAAYLERLLVQSLDETDERRPAEGAAVLRAEVRRLHRDLANSVLLLLTSAGRMSPKDANRWVHQHLKPPSGE